MEFSEQLATVKDVFAVGHSRNLMFQYAEDERVDGKHITLQGQRLLSFGSCSYLGLEMDPRLHAGVESATAKYGSQFSCSRGYVSSGLYRSVEDRFSEVFGGHALVTPTTTLGHLATIPVLVLEKDAIVLDHQVHASVQMAAKLAKANGAHVEVVRHGENAKLEERIADLCRTHRHVWHMVDGVFSMFGDLPDVVFLNELLARYPQFHLYVDDAHGMSVAGKHGRGIHLDRMPPHPRMILSTSFAKAFAAGGGCIVFPTEEQKELVRMCGAPLTFGGPMQPPMLGALSAGLDIHLSPEITQLQNELAERIDLLNDLCDRYDLPLLVKNHSPVFFIKMSSLRLAWRVAEALRDEHGIYVNVSPYPTVPMKRTGIRVAVTRHHTAEELERLCEAFAKVIPPALEAEGMTREDIERNFAELNEQFEVRRANTLNKLFELSDGTQGRRSRPRGPFTPPAGMELQHSNTIEAVDRETWDSLLADRGNFDWSTLRTLEGLFRDRPEPENNWNFHYFIVRQDGRPVLATFFIEALWKDDALMRASVSEVMEEKRREDPYFLTSRCLAMGSLMSEGNHLYLDRSGPWREAMSWVLDETDAIMKEAGCTVLIARDLPDGDPEFDAFMLDVGLVKAPMLAAYELRCTWEDDKAFLSTLSNRTRKYMREEVLGKESLFRMRVLRRDGEKPTEQDLEHIYELYMGVKRRKLRLNTFDLPRDLFGRLLESENWEVLLLYLDESVGGFGDAKPVAMGCCFAGPGRYTALICGADTVQRPVHTYRQLIWKTVRRARELNYELVELGLDADTEKLRIGADPRPQCIYLQLTDHFSGDLIGQVVQEAAMRKAG